MDNIIKTAMYYLAKWALHCRDEAFQKGEWYEFRCYIKMHSKGTIQGTTPQLFPVGKAPAKKPKDSDKIIINEWTFPDDKNK